jgi:hypothetical protein
LELYRYKLRLLAAGGGSTVVAMFRLLKSTLRALRQGRYFERGQAFGQQYRNAAPDGRATHQPGPLERYFDAVSEGPGIWKWRHYFDIYHRHFQKFVGRPVVVVEIGIYSGGSLLMWRDYFGEQSRIVGVDIEPACRQYAADSIDVFIGDQQDRGFWRDFCRQVPRIDIVIDDGGHQPEQQIATLECLLPHVSAGGVYLCEDVHGQRNRFGGYVGGLVQGLNHHDLLPQDEQSTLALGVQQSIASVHHYPFCVVIEKSPAPVERFVGHKHGTQWQPFVPGPHRTASELRRSLPQV